LLALSFFEELKRRNVFRVGAAYLVFAWLVVQLVETILPAFGYGHGAVRNVVILLALAFLPLLVLTWAYELTSEGIKRQREVDRTKGGSSAGRRLINAALAVLVTGAATFYAVDRLLLRTDLLDFEPGTTELISERPGAANDSHAVAVLPFVTRSSGPDDGYFADGLTEEILNSLASLPELRVTARTSAFHFKGTDRPIPEIAAALGVSHVVEGSVRRSGEQVRTTAQLIRAADGFQLWSETYDRTLEDVFAVQEDIARNIAEALNVVLDEDAVKRMREAGIGDVEAFIAYQKGNDAFATAHADLSKISEQLEIANRYYDQVLQVAPHLLEVRIRRTDRAGHSLFETAGGLRAEAWPGEGLAALEELDREYTLGWENARLDSEKQIFEVERMLFSNDWRGYSRKMDRALEGDDCVAGNWSYELGTHVGLVDATISRLRSNLRCDPMSSITRMALGQALIWAGDPEAALEIYREADALGVKIPFRRSFRLIAMLSAEELDGRSEPPVPVSDGSLYSFDDRLLMEASTGDPDKAQEMAAAYLARHDANDWSSMVAAAVVGNRQAANAAAARIDARPGGPFMLTIGSQKCFCGSPFDLEFTPNFRARLEESGFDWPPPSPIGYPLKHW
jgi:TolB-like protein